MKVNTNNAIPYLSEDENGVFLTDGRLVMRGDFTQLLPRLLPNRLAGEMLIKAAKIKNADKTPIAVDATAGMGEDSLLLAAAGYNVMLYEYDPVIAALLRDTLRRAAVTAELSDIVSRMRLFEEDSINALGTLDFEPEIILLDPMFPERSKSGLIKKKFQLLQRLERPCADEAALMEAAIAAHPHKIIVKRPAKGPFLAGRKPSHTINGKVIRYDCYVL